VSPVEPKDRLVAVPLPATGADPVNEVTATGNRTFCRLVASTPSGLFQARTWKCAELPATVSTKATFLPSMERAGEVAIRPPAALMSYDQYVLAAMPVSLAEVARLHRPASMVIASAALLAVAAVASVILVAGLPVMLAMVSFAGMPAPVIGRPISTGVMVPAVIATVILPFITIRLRRAARYIHGEYDEIIGAVRRSIGIETKFCREHGRRRAPIAQADRPILVEAACCAWNIILIVIVIAVMMPFFIAVPIFPYLFPPTLDCARIVLQGDHGLDRADARVGDMAPAPVLHYAVRMLVRLVFVPVLTVSSQANKAKQAECAQS
jgi:hypothetical protein